MGGVPVPFALEPGRGFTGRAFDQSQRQRAGAPALHISDFWGVICLWVSVQVRLAGEQVAREEVAREQP